MGRFNPWAHSRTEPEFSQPEYPEAELSRYAVNTPGDPTQPNPYMANPAGGWAPSLRLSPVGVPDETRLNEGEYVPTHAPADGEEMARRYWEKRNAETDERYSVETVAPKEFEETKDGFGHPVAALGFNRFAPNPRATPPAEPRWTQRLSPHRYSYVRPFQGGTPHRFTGEHFSMADHRRDYDVYGMQPPRRPGGSTRNTYRLPPAPWDAHIQDEAPPQAPVHLENVDVDVPQPSRSWRLT